MNPAALRPAAAVAAIAAVLGAVAAGAAFLLSDPVVADPGAPRLGGRPLVLVAAASPDIGPLETYDVNPINPFIPLPDRVPEQEAKSNQRRPPRPPPPPPPPPPPGGRVVLPPQPEPALPPLDVDADAPTATGLLTLDGRTRVYAQLGAGAPTLLAIGDAIGEWTLAEVDRSGIARFLHPSGRQHIAIVAIAAAQGTDASAGAAAHSAAAPAGPPGLPAGKIDLAQAQQLAQWLTPEQIDAVLARPDKDMILQQIANRLGGTLTPAQVEAMARQLSKAKRSQPEAPAPSPPAPRPPRREQPDPGSRPAPEPRR